MVRTKLLVIVFFSSFSLQAQVNRYMVFFTNKNGTPFSINNPEAFLTQRSIDRRASQNIDITSEDLPVTPSYLEGVRNAGLKLLYPTKWMNGVMVEGTATQAQGLSSLPYVSSVEYIAPGERPVVGGRVKAPYEGSYAKDFTAVTDTQVSMLGMDIMHQNGYRGEGMLVAIMDAGFPGADTISYFKHVFDEGRFHASGSYDFVAGGSDVFRHHPHGTNVWSTMGGYKPEVFVGGAYKADYVLFVTEYSPSEYRVEEYNWLLAAERADSLGVDVINTSLGYSTFDDPQMNYSTSQMNGEVSVISRASALSVNKGMAVITSAGNEGGTSCSWCIITAPADGKKVLAVGAVTSEGGKSSFSSVGPSSDGRVKPDVAAMGTGVSIVRSDGTIGVSNGTSFAGPLMASFVTNYWQKYRTLSVPVLFDSVRSKGSLAESPNNLLGYGIPHFTNSINTITAIQPETSALPISMYPNPVTEYVVLESRNSKPFTYQISDLQGSFISIPSREIENNKLMLDLNEQPAGVYFLKVSQGTNITVYKILKGTR